MSRKALREKDWLFGTEVERMQAVVWPHDESPLASDRKLRLFACACCRNVSKLLANATCRTAIETSEQFADGAATESELQNAEGTVWKECGGEDSGSLEEAAAWVACPVEAAYWNTPEIIVVNGPRSTKRALAEWKSQSSFLRDIFGNPFRPVTLHPHWQSANVVDLARAIYEDRAFDRMPILAVALMDAGCDNEDVIQHCRGPGPHVRGCWVVDLILGKE